LTIKKKLRIIISIIFCFLRICFLSTGLSYLLLICTLSKSRSACLSQSIKNLSMTLYFSLQCRTLLTILRSSLIMRSEDLKNIALFIQNSFSAVQPIRSSWTTDRFWSTITIPKWWNRPTWSRWDLQPFTPKEWWPKLVRNASPKLSISSDARRARVFPAGEFSWTDIFSILVLQNSLSISYSIDCSLNVQR